MARGINFGNLDALRGMLAVYVALGHCRWLLWGGHEAWLASPHAAWETVPAYASAALRYGREAVMVFFVLSGFFIHYRAADARRREPVAAAPFYRRRLHRLGPPYFLALAVTVALDLIGRSWWPTLYEARTGDQVVDTTFVVGGYSSTSILPAILMLPSSLGRDFGSNGPLWSIAYEAVYYAVYPLWLWVRRRSALVAFVVMPALCLLIALGPVQTFAVAVAVHYPIWLLGAFVAERVVANAMPVRSMAIGAVMFAGGAAVYAVNDLLLVRLIAAPVFGAGLVLTVGGWPRDRVVTPAFEWLGIRSYSIYIVHYPVVALISAYLFETFGGRPLHGGVAVIGALACIGFGILCFEACERHFLHSRYRDASAAP